MIRYPILDICARIHGHEVQYSRLREYCHRFTDWENLLHCAEREGMSPLLQKHLEESGSAYPVTIRRSLSILGRRHQHQAKLRTEILLELLDLFRQNGLTPMLIKGAALCHTLYPRAALRPMRDIDILFREQEAHTALELLQDSGFFCDNMPFPVGHFHLPSLFRQVDGIKLCVEIHRGLYPDCPPFYPEVEFDELLGSAKKFKVRDMDAITFGNEETLHYLFQHAIRAPLTYEPYKLINAADIISFTEENFATLDWRVIRRNYPRLYKVLPLLHHISPWDLNKVPESFVSLLDSGRRLEPMPFTGWPQRRFKEFKGRMTLGRVLTETFLPPPWWLRVYYGAVSGWSVMLARCFSHPRNVFWWAHFYSNFVIEIRPEQRQRRSGPLGGLSVFVVSTRNKILGVIKKLGSL